MFDECVFVGGDFFYVEFGEVIDSCVEVDCLSDHRCVCFEVVWWWCECGVGYVDGFDHLVVVYERW